MKPPGKHILANLAKPVPIAFPIFASEAKREPPPHHFARTIARDDKQAIPAAKVKENALPISSRGAGFRAKQTMNARRSIQNGLYAVSRRRAVWMLHSRFVWENQKCENVRNERENHRVSASIFSDTLSHGPARAFVRVHFL